MTAIKPDAAVGSERPLARSELVPFHETRRGRPILVFAVSAGGWVALLALGLWADEVLVRAALSVPLALALGQLFTIGHDAAHGSFSTSRAANAVMGRLALLPSLHVFGLWRVHHNTHHRYTNLRGRDFVWAPLSVDEYRRLPRRRRALHRFYRNRFGAGLGLHYAIEIWIPRVLYPREVYRLAGRRRLLADAVLLYALVVVLGYLSYRFALVVDAERATSAGYWLSVVLLLFVAPVAGAHWLIGFVIYLNHTHPDIVWYDDPAEWAQRDVQLECSAGQRFESTPAPLPRRIMNHTAHHVDPGVPLRRLASAQRHLIHRYHDRIISYVWSLRAFGQILSVCKLYDYDAHQWLTYDSAVAGPS